MLHLRTETTSTAFWTYVAHKNRDPRRGRSLANAHWNARLHGTFALKSSVGCSESEGWLRLLSGCTVDRLHRPHHYDPFINIGLRPSFCRACIFFPTCTSVYCLHGSKWRRINSVRIHLRCLCTEHVYAAPPEIANCCCLFLARRLQKLSLAIRPGLSCNPYKQQYGTCMCWRFV